MSDAPTGFPPSLEYELRQGHPDPALLSELEEISDQLFPGEACPLAERLALRAGVVVQLVRHQGRAVAFKIACTDAPSRLHSWRGGVLPDWRRRGLARELIRRQHRWARDQGFREITMATRNRTRGMLLLAIQEGFDVTGVRLSGQDEPLILLRKRLGDSGA